MKWSIRLGRLFGIDVYLHFTFLLFLVFIGFSHWQQDPRWQAVALGTGFFVALFGCVLLHEFGHALMARRFGVGTRDITLLPIGGIARLERIPEKPVEELWVALAGPAVNVVIAGGIFLWLKATSAFVPLSEMSLVGGPLLERLMMVNVFLVAFNMLPAFPMDGGRVLRALLAMRMDYSRATTLAARIGQGMAVGFAVLGLYTTPMLFFIAFFVWMGAAGEADLAQMKSALGGIPVARAMMRDFQVLAPGGSLQGAVDHILAGSQQDFPVVEKTVLVGLLSRSSVLRALAERGPQSLISEAMQREFSVLDPAMPLEAALALLNESENRLLPVLEHGVLVGLLTGENLGEFLLIQAALKQPRV